MTEDSVNVKFGADIADLKDKVDDVLGMFGKITERFAALAAVVAGGEAFREIIKSFNDMESSAERMSRMLGISADEAQVLRVALDDVGAQLGDGSISAETYTGAFLKFNRQLRMNSDTLKSYGVDVDAVTNGTKTSNQVFQEALGIVGKYKPGIDQTQVAMEMFGRSVSDVNALMQLTPELIEESRKHAQALNLVLSEEGVKAAKAYRAEMNNVHDVLEGVENTIAQAVMPHFTEMAKALASIGPQIVEGAGASIQVLTTLWDQFGDVVGTVWDSVKGVLNALLGGITGVFGEGAPNAMEIFKAAITIVQRAVVLFGTGLQEVFNAIGTVLALTASKFRTLSEVAWAALHFDWGGVKKAWQDGTERANSILEDGINKALKIAAEGQKKLEGINIAALAMPKGTPAGSQAGTGTKHATIGKDQSGQDPRLAALLAMQKAQEDAALKLQLEYLKEAGDQYDNAFKNNLITVQQYYDARLAIETKANQLELDTLKKELAAASAAEAQAQAKSKTAIKQQDRMKAEAEVLKFKTEQIKLQGQINVLEAQGADIARKNANDRLDAERKITDQLLNQSITRAQQRANAEIAATQAEITQLQALRKIDAQQAFDLQRQEEEKSFAAAKAALQAKRAMIRGDNEQAQADRDAIDVQIEAAEQAHQQRMTEIDRQAVIERRKLELDAAQSIQDAWAQSTNQFLNGQKSLWGALKSFIGSTLAAINNMIAQTLAKKLFGAGSEGGGILDKILGSISGSFGGFFADGGTLQPGQWGVVGENGPELIRGGASGKMVLPAGMLAGALAAGSGVPSAGAAPGMGGPNVTQHIAIHVQGPVDTRTQQQIFAGIGRAAQNAMRRNG